MYLIKVQRRVASHVSLHMLNIILHKRREVNKQQYILHKYYTIVMCVSVMTSTRQYFI